MDVFGVDGVSTFIRFLIVLACDLVQAIDFLPLAAILSFEGSDRLLGLRTDFFGTMSSVKITSYIMRAHGSH